MIDSHCHLNFDELKNNFSNIINNIKKNNITGVLSINTDPNNFDDHYQLIKDYEFIYLSYGLHPENVSDTVIINKDKIIENTINPKVIGIGETGLDFYHSKKFSKQQYNVFEQHIEASIDTDLPLILHQRNSENEMIDVLQNYQKQSDLKVVFHCFTGTKKLMNFCIDNNYYISISGIATFKNALSLRNVIKDVPLSSLLLETDSPFLAPVPMRGKINEPSFVKYTAIYLSEFYNISLNAIIEMTDKNFYKLFSKALRYNKTAE